MVLCQDWGKSIVSGKKYSTDTEIGLELFTLVNEGINGKVKSDVEKINEIESEVNAISLKGAERMALVKTRVNQSVFRERLLKKSYLLFMQSRESGFINGKPYQAVDRE